MKKPRQRKERTPSQLRQITEAEHYRPPRQVIEALEAEEAQSKRPIQPIDWKLVLPNPFKEM